MFPKAINFHLLRSCNARCRYCFATFRDTPTRLTTKDAIAVLREVRRAGGEKMNFVGGEPTLHPGIAELITEAKSLGFTTSIVSNGAKLKALLASSAGKPLDWVGLSIDSATNAGNEAVGRSKAPAANGVGYVEQSVELAKLAAANGSHIRLNTVVSRVNVDEDMRPLIERVRPERWKLFQVLPVRGQNDGAVEPLLITRAEFEAFVERHRSLADEGIPVIAESNDAMTDSYAMIDPMGRFFSNTGGVHTVGRAILEVGAEAALRSVAFDNCKLLARGGVYEWTNGTTRAYRSLPVVQAAHPGGAGCPG